jgi:hypothetical protein
LHVVALEVLVEETGVVSSWGKLGVGEGLVIVSNSWDILWSIDNVWIVGSPEILLLGTVKSLGRIIKIKPISSWSSCLIIWRLIVSLSLN